MEFQPPVLRHPTLDPACPLFKIVVPLPLFSVLAYFKVLQRLLPTFIQPSPALIQPNRIEEKPKACFYQFNC